MNINITIELTGPQASAIIRVAIERDSCPWGHSDEILLGRVEDSALGAPLPPWTALSLAAKSLVRFRD